MTHEQAEQLAYKHMYAHGLISKGWRFVWDNAVCRFGQCRHRRKEISLSRHLTPLSPNAEDTILHEIAHALVGRGHGHDHVWRAKAIEIGCNGQRCGKNVDFQGKYIAICPDCGHVHYKHRNPRGRVYGCYCTKGKFFVNRNDRYKLVFKEFVAEEDDVDNLVVNNLVD